MLLERGEEWGVEEREERQRKRERERERERNIDVIDVNEKHRLVAFS